MTKAIELSGVHIGKRVLIVWRFPSWPQSRKSAVKEIQITQVEHKPNGKVVLESTRRNYPFDADITFVN